MFVVDGKIVSKEIFDRKFVCNLSKCQGACCWEGDFGAPVSQDEELLIASILEKVKDILSDESKRVIEEQGIAPWSALYEGKVTPLLSDGSCAYMVRENKIAQCAFEILYENGETDFQKPISCHLYPIRISENSDSKFEALNYDEWDICSAACDLGEELSTPVFRFVKEGIIRKYGQDFYDQLEDIFKTYLAQSGI